MIAVWVRGEGGDVCFEDAISALNLVKLRYSCLFVFIRSFSLGKKR